MDEELNETTIEIPPKVIVAGDTTTTTAATDEAVAATATTDEVIVEERRSENEEAIPEEAPPPPAPPLAESLSRFLPANTYAQISPRCYMFPGAEVTHESLEEESDADSEEEDYSDDDEDEATSSNEIIVPDIDNVVPAPEASPTPSTSSSSLSSSCQLQSSDREIVTNIDEAVDAKIIVKDDLEGEEEVPIKRQRLAAKSGDGKELV